MKKKLFAILLSIVMVAGLLPTVAFATENYNLYVNGEQFTSEKLSIACGEGTASYDPNTKTRIQRPLRLTMPQLQTAAKAMKVLSTVSE